MKSDERIFWVVLVLVMFVFSVLVRAGLLHRIWPDVFDSPAVCKSDANAVPALVSQAKEAINSEARQQTKGVA